MLEVIHTPSVLSNLEILKNRTKHSKPAEFKNSSKKVSSYRDGGIFVTRFSGYGRWERHQNGDEMVQILEGETKLFILTQEGKQSFELKSGNIAVIPQGVWHYFHSENGVCVMTVTPHPTEHSIDEPVL